MTPERWRHVTEVFHAALARDASARASYLDQACAGDGPLRDEVDAMLGAHVIPGDASLTHMPRLTSDTMIGPYRVAELIGAGGMGEVYRARDTKLGRDVAIKVLPAEFTSDADRLARFEREARLLAALNHPHIAAIYGFEEADGVVALILELVEGDTLADRLDRGPIPLDQALPIARQLAEALEAAHEKRIIHRDLKPANIKITPDGTVKVLDFGLAKAWIGEGTTNVSASPTVTATALRAGVVMGTAAYMSPEQAHGTAVDKRTDIWAFGCVLYEMLTGRHAFADDDVSGTLARVLMKDPDWNALPRTTPPALRRLLRRCLMKDRRQRLSDAADARLEIEEAQALPATEATTDALFARLPTWRRTAGASLAVALIVGATVGTTVWLTTRPAPPAVSRLLVPLGTGERFTAAGRHLVALSPDGRHVVYQANQGLYLRPLDRLQATLLSGTEDGGGRSPFFSPDGMSIGFWAGGQLKRIGLSGGVAVTLCAADNPWGVSWEPNGTILFGQGPRGILKVSETGGTPEVVIAVEEGEQAHGPQLLAGGEWVLFTLRPKGVSRWDAAQIVAQSLRTGERRVLVDRGRDARYVPTGHLLYSVESALLAVPFDVGALRPTGGTVSLIEGIWNAGNITAAVHFSIATDGSLVYVPGDVGGAVPQRTLVWIDRQGREELINAPPNAYYPRLSPDGTRVAHDMVGVESRNVWIWDFSRRTATRFTFDASWYPIWTPDGQRLVWGGARDGPFNLYWQAADGTGAVQRLTASPNDQAPYGFSPDGTRLLLREESPELGETLAVLSLNDDRRVTPLMRPTFKVRNGEISPDGRWLAYESDESGREEIYVRPFPEIERGRWQVSADGGSRPLWARNIRELFFQAPDGSLLGVLVGAEGGGFLTGTPTKLVDGRYYMGTTNTPTTSSGRNYDVSPDGQRFLVIKDDPAAAAPTAQRLVIVQNWFEELKRRVPTP